MEYSSVTPYLISHWYFSNSSALSDDEDQNIGETKKRRKPKIVRKRLTPQSKGVKEVPSPKKARPNTSDAGMISMILR